MKPNFALSLSFEGIKLLHRAAGGWREVGEVPVTSDTLGAELAVLRKTAASLAPEGVRTKLVIPATQIKYLTIDTVGLSDAARRKAAETALHDATPYEVADLAYDISVEGTKTHIAAVARETLAEAEAFATEHRFYPVSFVATPGGSGYLGEPFFGTTKGAAALLEPDETVEPDGIAVVIVGAVTPTVSPAPKADPVSEVETLSEVESVSAVELAPLPDTAPSADTVSLADTVSFADTVPEAASAAEVNTDVPQERPDVEPQAAGASEPEIEPDRAPAVDVEKAQQTAPENTAGNPVARTSVPEPADAASSLEVASPVEAAAFVTDAPPVAAPTHPETEAPPSPPSADTADKAAIPDTAIPDAAKAAAPGAAAAVVPATNPSLKASQKPTFTATKPAGTTSKGTTFTANKEPDAPTPQTGEATATSFTSRRIPVPTPAKPLGGARRLTVPTPQPDSSSLTQPTPVADHDAAVPPKTGFLSRRKPRAGTNAPLPGPAAQKAAAGTEAERMTVFGARADTVGGKPRFLGLVMTVILLVFLAGVAAWAAVFLDEGISSLIKSDDKRTVASDPENQIDPQIIRTPDSIETPDTTTSDGVQVAALDPVLSAEDTAVLDVLRDPRPEPQRPVITEQEAAARYAVTGIWPLAPSPPVLQSDTPEEPVYRSGIDPVSAATDALALPAARAFETDTQLAAVLSPAPFAQRSVAGAGALLTPTETGILAPGGFTLIAASPPLKPPVPANRLATLPELTEPEAAIVSPLADARPKYRPLGLAERTERAQLGGVSRVELAAYRPSLRPRSLQDRAKQADEAAKQAQQEAQDTQEARAIAAAQAATAAAVTAALIAPEAPDTAIQSATRLATAQSVRPDTRPRNFDRIVKRATSEAPTAAPEETRVAAVASVAPRSVTPSLPSKASVARSATVKNAINLRKINLIGVYGKPSSRRALVRLSNGRYKKVKVGDRIDGGRVAAISNSELRYAKGGRNVVLKMP